MRNRFVKISPVAAGLLSLLFLFTAMPVTGQESRSLNIGEISYYTDEAFTSDDLHWPRGRRHTQTEMLDTYGITIGIRNTDGLSTPDGVTPEFFVAQVMQNKFSDMENVTKPVPGAFKRVFRNPYPDKVLDGMNWTSQFDQTDPVDGTIPSDAMIYNKVDTWTGIQVERWAYAFASDQYDDMVILEYRFTNTSGTKKEDVVLGLNGDTNADWHYPGNLWGNYYGANYRHYVAGDAQADSMRMWYSWDANQTVSNPGEDSRGNPNSQWGYFTEPQFMGIVVLHADRGPSDENDDPAQPFKAGWSQRDLVKNMNEADHPTIYQYLTQPWDTRNPTGPQTYSKIVNHQGVEMPGQPDGLYRVMRTEGGKVAPEGFNLHAFDPELEQEKNNLMSFGPYDLEPGEDIRIVTAFVGGAIPPRLAIDAGRAYDNGMEGRQVFGVNPLPSGLSYDDMHGNPIVRNGDVYDLEGNVIARSGEKINQQQKDQILDMGQKLVFKTASMAIQAWKQSNVTYGQGSFNIPFAPAAPSLEGTSENDQIRLKWSDNQQDSRGGPIKGYRIYREYKRPPSLTSPHDTTFLMIADLPADQKEYVDAEVVRGEDYYYYVTAYNEAGIESSRFQNRTGTSQEKQDEALAPTRAPDAGWEDNVVVVPNPYHVQASEKYPGKRLNFLNLPPYANVHIYTMTGERVQTIKHDSNTGDVDWERQDTFSTMEIVSGVYIYVVDELDGPNGSPTGKQAIGKFVVVK